jgi:hypothetical protein
MLLLTFVNMLGLFQLGINASLVTHLAEVFGRERNGDLLFQYQEVFWLTVVLSVRLLSLVPIRVSRREGWNRPWQTVDRLKQTENLLRRSFHC